MKLLGLYSILLAFLLSISACSNELDLTAPWKDVSIVYGMLNTSDTAQYIRVERAFLDPEKNALNFTKNPDSIYYKNATVSLVNLGNGEQFDLEKVDGNTEGFVRDTGIWAQAPNYLYKINSNIINLVEGNQYQLIINKGDDQPETRAQTQVIGVPEITRPVPSQKVSFSHSDYVLNWKASVGAELYDVDVVFNYSESLESNPAQFVDKSIKWKALIGLQPRNSLSQVEVHGFQGIEFYRWLKATIPKKNVKRHFKSVNFIVTAGGVELKNYFAVSQANFGITGSETLTDYTNIPEGFGIFSSIAKAYTVDFDFTDTTLDSLKGSYLTKPLNFQ